MAQYTFRPVTIADKELIQSYTFASDSMNCDLNFMNICSWQFLYDTQFAVIDRWLVFRFMADGHLAYMIPKQKADPKKILEMLLADSEAQGHNFLLLGVLEGFVGRIDAAMPGKFRFSHDRDYSDYIYTRQHLETLAGRHLQSKRNHINKFLNLYPDYEFRPLTKEMIPDCRALEKKWRVAKNGDEEADEGYADELRSMNFVFDNWDALDSVGGTIFVDGKMIAFTFGAAINGETFDVCVEKADTAYEGSFTIINRDFVRSLPSRFKYINREEDLGIDGLRRAKLSYHPDMLLNKYAVMEKRLFM